MTEAGDSNELAGLEVFPENNAAVERQRAAPISVIVGNPPYSVGQSSGNDDNQNLAYRSLDGRIRDTYAAVSAAKLKRNLYDSYVRAIRWASDRIGERGVVGFVTNGGFLDANSADGMRRVLAEEFGDLYVLNLRGNQRTAGEQSRKEGGKVFGAGSRATIVIVLLVKAPGTKGGGLHYRDIGDYLTREQKLAVLRSFRSVGAVPWLDHGRSIGSEWLDQGDERFLAFAPMGATRSTDGGIFAKHSNGLVTNRDVWTSNFSHEAVVTNMQHTIEYYNESVGMPSGSGVPVPVDEARHISWTRGLRAQRARGRLSEYAASAIVREAYRPFTRHWLYLDKMWNEGVGANDTFFPEDRPNRLIFVMPSDPSGPLAALIVDSVADLHLIGSGSVFPRYIYEKRESATNELDVFGEDQPGHTRVDNVSDAILSEYRKQYGAEVTKDDIFFYVYGILHSPEYRERFAADLKKMLPRIPKVSDFWGFAKAGRELSELHLGYESVEPWPLEAVLDGGSTHPAAPDYSTRIPEEALRVTKMRYVSKADKSAVIVNARLTLRGIPAEAHEYLLGSRSALDWILERYQIKTDKASGIVNDPNAWGEEHGDPRYIVDLVGRIARVSVETVAIVKALPALDIRPAG